MSDGQAVERQTSPSHDEAPENVATANPPSEDFSARAEVAASRAIGTLSRAMFKNEERATFWWLMYISVYFTVGAWTDVLVDGELLHPSLFTWAVVAVGLFASWYLYREGKYPSGATKEDMSATNGTGRYGAIYVNLVIAVSICVLLAYGLGNGFSWTNVVLTTFHIIALTWGSFFYYDRFRRSNPEIATGAFFSEWADILFSFIVIAVMHDEISDNLSGESCYDFAICVVYLVFMILQILGWICPMMMIQGWGTSENATLVCAHLFFLDILCDMPVIIAVLAEKSYRAYWIIFADMLWKTSLMVRSTSYYLVFYVWLKKGDRLFGLKSKAEEEVQAANEARV